MRSLHTSDLEVGAFLPARYGQSAQPEQVELPQPISRWWCLFPIVFGAGWGVIGLHEEWLKFCFGDLLPTPHIRVLMIFFCITFIAHTITIFYVCRISESEEYKGMANAVCAGSPRNLDELVSDITGIVRESTKVGACSVVMYGLVGYFSFERWQAGVLASTLGLLVVISRFETMFLYVMVKMCNQDVNNFIALMIPDVPEGSPLARADKSSKHFMHCPDWQSISAAHREMDWRMESLWAPRVGSSLLGPAVLLRIGQGLGILIIGVVLDEVRAKLGAWAIGFVRIMSAIFILQGTADLTMRCQTGNPRFGLTAIRVVVNGFACHCRMSQKQETCFVKFNGYIQNAQVGVELFGMMVTPGLVSQLILALLTNIPIVVGLLQNFMKRDASHLIS